MSYKLMPSRYTQKATYATLVATAVAMAFAVLPALIQQQASAVPAPKTEEKCSDLKFAERESCPGKSEDAKGNDREDLCIARNPGQAKNCEGGADEVVNPP